MPSCRFALDTCAGMTWIAYEALIRELKARGASPLPDSREVAEGGDQPWTCTLLTGEDTNHGRAPFAFVNEGQPGRSWGGADYLGGLRFRPTPGLVGESACGRGETVFRYLLPLPE